MVWEMEHPGEREKDERKKTRRKKKKIVLWKGAAAPAEVERGNRKRRFEKLGWNRVANLRPLGNLNHTGEAGPT